MFYRKKVDHFDSKVLREQNFTHLNSDEHSKYDYPEDLSLIFKPLHGYDLLRSFYLSINENDEDTTQISLKPKLGSLFFLSCYGYLILFLSTLIITVSKGGYLIIPLLLFVAQFLYFYSGVKKINDFTESEVERVLIRSGSMKY